MSKELYASAQRWADWGCSVFPVRFTTENGEIRKVPIVRWGEYRDKPADAQLLSDWFLQAPDYYAIGLITGQEVSVLDIDDKLLFEKYRHRYPDALAIATHKGGHLIFRHREGITNKVGVNGEPLDIRGEGGMAVTAPFSYGDKYYKIIRDVEHLADLPYFPHIPVTVVDVPEYDRHDSTDEGIWQAISDHGIDDEYDYQNRNIRCLAAARALIRQGKDERGAFNALRDAIKRGPDTTFTMQEVKKCVTSAYGWYKKQLQEKKEDLPYAGLMKKPDGWRHLPAPVTSFIDHTGFIQDNMVTMMLGKSGAGKSFIATDLAVDMAEHGKSVLYLAFEGYASVLDRFKGRLRNTEARLGVSRAVCAESLVNVIGDDGSDIYRLIHNHFTNRGSDKEIDRDTLDRLLSTNGVTPYDVVMVDTAIAAWTYIDENNSNDVRKVLQPFERWVTRNNTAFVYLHHEGKDASKGARGSSDWTAFASNIVAVRKKGQPPNDRYFMRFTKGRDLFNDVMAKRWETSIIVGDNSWRQQYKLASDKVMTDDEEIKYYNMLVIDGGSWSSIKKLTKAMGIREEEGKKLVRKWQEEGHLMYNGSLYYLPDRDEDDIQTD